MLALKLAISNLRAHRVRFGLAAAATAIAVALVVSISSGFASIDRVIRLFVLSFMGTTDFELSKPNSNGDGAPTLSASLLNDLRKDPRVHSVHGRLQREDRPIGLYEDGTAGVIFNKPPITVLGIQPDADPSVRFMYPRSGAWFTQTTGKVVVIDSNLAERLKLGVGGKLRFQHPRRLDLLELTVVGIIHMPNPVGDLFLSAYVPADTLREFEAPDSQPSYDKIRAEFNADVDAKKFYEEWKAKLAGIDPKIVIESKRENREKLDNNLRGLKLAATWGSLISICAAAFIIFTTLSMGVAERRRQLAMLRAVGATRSLVASLVFSEGFFLALFGVVVGVPLGLGFLSGLVALYPGVFGGVGNEEILNAPPQAPFFHRILEAIPSGNAIVDPWGIGLAAAACFVTALLASAWPAIVASRASPLEAMTHQASASKPGFPWRTLVLGLILSSLDSLLVFTPLAAIAKAQHWTYVADHANLIKVPIRFVVTIPALLLGLFLIAPVVVIAVERFVGPLLTWITGIRFELLQQQLSGSVWRAAGTAAALMVGLTILIVMNAQGRSTLQSWQIPRRFPDVFIFVRPDFGIGIDSLGTDVVREIQQTPGVRADHVMAIRITVPGLGDNLLALGAWVSAPTRTLFVATDPRLLLEMMDLDFRVGDAVTARRMLDRGRHVLLKDGTVLDGTIEKDDPVKDGKAAKDDRAVKAFQAPVELLTLKGEHRTLAPAEIKSIEHGRYLLVTNEMQRLGGLTVGSLVPLNTGNIVSNILPGSNNDVNYTIVGVVWSPGVDVLINAFDLPNNVENQTAYTVFGTTYDVERDFNQFTTRILAADIDKKSDSKKVQKALQDKIGMHGLTVIDVRDFRDHLVGIFDSVLGFMSSIAWSAMLVASLGVGNAVVAGVRTRQWQFGVLRAIGLQRSHILRLVLIEGFLLGLCGAVLGLIGGLILSVDARHFYADLVGVDPPLVLPWDMIGMGMGAVIVLAVLMSAWPAIAASRREPLSLLQTGRAST